VLLSRFLHIF